VIGRLRPYVSVTSYPGGTTHGTHHDYDRHVPVLFLGPGIAPGRSPRPCGPEDIAATLARLLGLRYPLQEGTRAFPEVAP